MSCSLSLRRCATRLCDANESYMNKLDPSLCTGRPRGFILGRQMQINGRASSIDASERGDYEFDNWLF